MPQDILELHAAAREGRNKWAAPPRLGASGFPESNPPGEAVTLAPPLERSFPGCAAPQQGWDGKVHHLQFWLAFLNFMEK